jgi:hypothetical protein
MQLRKMAVAIGMILSFGVFAASALAARTLSNVDVTMTPTSTNTLTTTFSITITPTGNVTDAPLGSLNMAQPLHAVGGGTDTWNSVSVAGTTGGATVTNVSVNAGAIVFNGSVGVGQTVTLTASATNPNHTSQTCDTSVQSSSTALDVTSTTDTVANGGPSFNDWSGCELEFAQQPSDATVGQPMTPAPVVDVVGPCDCNTVTTLITDYNGPVTISLVVNRDGLPTLGGTTTVNAVNGVATFNNLTISGPASGLEFRASAGDMLGLTSGGTSEISNAFAANDVETTCTQPGTNPPVPCSTTLQGPTGLSSFTITATGDPNHPNTATLSENVDVGTDTLTCAGLTAPSPDFYEYFINSQFWSKTGVMVVKPTRFLRGLITAYQRDEQVCYGAPFDFVASNGRLAPPGTLPDGSSGFIGQLPNCGSAGATVCIESRGVRFDPSSPIDFDLITKFFVPEFLAGDPFARCC